SERKRIVLRPGEHLDFGREETCDLVVGRGDRGVSHKAGRIFDADAFWWVANVSKVRSLHIYENGFGYPLFRQDLGLPKFWPLRNIEATVLVPGDRYTYSVHVRQAGASKTPFSDAAPLAPSSVCDSFTLKDEVLLTAAEHRAMVAVCARYLSPIASYE